jgi:uncharacterized protein YndB with AHSA1/START domain
MSTSELMISRTFANVSAERLFDAWTDPATLAKWYGPEGMQTEVHSLDLRPGGSYRLTMHAPNGDSYPLRGQFREIERPGRLVFSWQWEGAAGSGDMGGEESLVSVTIRSSGKDATLTLTHSAFAGAEQVASHQKGWEATMPRLERLLAA